ncbi:MAG: replication restart helicase PriA, partial [Fusobacteriaceae bacterium]
EKYKIMVGTQMVTKGFHFPNVTLVGVISADMSLAFPDFRSGERTFQLLTQVAGRAGRGEKPGEVVIQTYQPDNHIFQDIINSDYETFYRKEIEDRKILFYPPFSKIINIGISSKDEVKLEEISKKIYNSILDESVEIYGPMRSMVYKVKDRYRQNIFIKGNRDAINVFKRKLNCQLKDMEKERDVRVVVDIDPINLV